MIMGHNEKQSSFDYILARNKSIEFTYERALGADITPSLIMFVSIKIVLSKCIEKSSKGYLELILN